MVRAVADRPNILFFHVDNLGFGELSCYSGEPFRGATTERIDAFADEGFGGAMKACSTVEARRNLPT